METDEPPELVIVNCFAALAVPVLCGAKLPVSGDT